MRISSAEGVLHQSIIHLRDIWLKKFRDLRARCPTRPSTRCRRPRRRLLVKVTAAGTLWVRPEHVGSMATTTTDDILMVYGDGAEGVFETQQTCVRTSQACDRPIWERLHSPLSWSHDPS